MLRPRRSAQSLRHLPPRQAACVFAEGTRVANKLLIIDVPRMPLPHVVQMVFLLPLDIGPVHRPGDHP